MTGRCPPAPGHAGRPSHSLTSPRLPQNMRVAHALRLTAEIGKGFDAHNLRYMRAFYQQYPIWNAVRTELSWTHYNSLSPVQARHLSRSKWVVTAIGPRSISRPSSPWVDRNPRFFRRSPTYRPASIAHLSTIVRRLSDRLLMPPPSTAASACYPQSGLPRARSALPARV